MIQHYDIMVPVESFVIVAFWNPVPVMKIINIENGKGEVNWAQLWRERQWHCFLFVQVHANC